MLLAATSGAAMPCEGGQPHLQAGYRSTWSDWFEFDAAGRQIVHEAGVLRGTELAAALDCGRWQWQAQASQSGGVRMYDGQTSTGAPALSQSAISLLQGHVQAGWRPSDAWMLGVRMAGQTLWRDIASTATASGYPERYDWSLLSLGARWQAVFDAGQLTLGLWKGAALQSTMRVGFTGYDPAVLPLGAISQLELSAGWRIRLSPAWQVQADVHQIRTDMAQGADVIITRSGQPAGVAHQPQTRMRETSLAIRIGYEF
jgi:hypothetical protein